MARPNILIMSGYGINCERETAYAFDRALFSPEQKDIDARIELLDSRDRAQVVHINDVIADTSLLDDCHILVWPGGFSMGDDTGSGLAYAHYAKDRLGEALVRFRESDTLSLGICNGFQIMTHLGFFPVGNDNYGTPKTALAFNSNARYRDVWVDMGNDDVHDKCAWLQGIGQLHLPIAHGEGRFYASDSTLVRLKHSGQGVLRYVNEDGSYAKGGPANPNGSLDDIAGICDPSGRFLGMMPHPERAILNTQDNLYTRKRELAARKGVTLPEETGCMKLFRNAIDYFR